MRIVIAALIVLLSVPASAELFVNKLTGKPMAKQVASFTLTDQDGKAVTKATLAGKPTVIFWGYTSCPTYCPDTLQRLALAKRQVPNLQVLFITVDPADGPQQLKAYAKLHGVIVARGDSLALMMSVGMNHGMDLSHVAHSTTAYLLDSKMQLVGGWTYPSNLETMIAELKQVR